MTSVTPVPPVIFPGYPRALPSGLKLARGTDFNFGIVLPRTPRLIEETQGTLMQFTRRRFVGAAATLLAAAGTGLLAACQGPAAPTSTPAPATPPSPPLASPSAVGPAAPAGVASTPGAAAAQPARSPLPSPASVPAAVQPSPSAVASRQTAAPVAANAGKQMYQQDAQHTGRSPSAGPRQGTLLRRFDAGAPQNMPPDPVIPRPDFQSSSVIGADGTIYIANFPGMLFALRDSASASDQLEIAWRFHVAGSSSLHATPALSSDGSIVYLGFASGGFGANAPAPRATLYALKAAASSIDPQVVWTADLGAARVMASPTVGPDGTIYVANSAGLLFAVAPDGTVKWTAQTGPTVKSAPALATDGTLYHATSDGNMYAISSQGQVEWTFNFGEHLGPTPLVVSETSAPGSGGGANGVGSGASPAVGPDGTVYIGANNSNMYAVRPDGSMKWLFEAERELAGIWTTPVLSTGGDTLYFGANKGGVYALDVANGSRKWQFAVYGSVYASSVLDSRGVLYTGTTIEHVYALDSVRGEQIWDYDAQNEVWSAPSIRPNGTLVIADRGGLIHVLG
ncbi:MAG: PQQ-binding-like beta-propeller repeat protein [Chloroflexota bacterium]